MSLPYGRLNRPMGSTPSAVDRLYFKYAISAFVELNNQIKTGNAGDVVSA